MQKIVCEKCGSPKKLLLTQWYCDCLKRNVCIPKAGIIANSNKSLDEVYDEIEKKLYEIDTMSN